MANNGNANGQVVATNATAVAVAQLAAKGAPACGAALATARAAFNKLDQGWRPTTVQGLAARHQVRVARAALTLATASPNVRAAYVASGHKPIYAGYKVRVAAK